MNTTLLLKYGYFPKELPPPFTTETLGSFATTKDFPKIKLSYVSRPCLHNLARPGNQRRVLGLPNPFNYFLLSKLLNDNAIVVTSILNKSKLSVSKPKLDETNSRAYIADIDGKGLPGQRAKGRAGAKYILRADISRFYHSIYTHSIPWAIMGKAWAKKNMHGGFSNDLDLLLRNAQDRQTLGIPVGPDASFIVAELIACSIDYEIQKRGLKGFRYMDDYEFRFLSRADADKALPILESILQEYELALNPTKSFVDDLPIALEQSWRIIIKNKSNTATNTDTELLEYFDLLFRLHKEHKNEPVLRYGIACLRSSYFVDSKLLIDLLLQCVLVEPGTLKESIFLLVGHEIHLKKSKLTPILSHLISNHGPMKHGSEVAWALWAAIYYEIKLSNRTISHLKGFNDSIIALLVLHAYKKGLVSNIVKSFWKNLMTSSSLTNGNWLLAYEADLKGWLPSIDGKNHIEADEYFSVLKEHEISFYNENVEYFVDEADQSDGYDSINTDLDVNTDDDDDD